MLYTWFNRFCALRFTEVNGFLPTRIDIEEVIQTLMRVFGQG